MDLCCNVQPNYTSHWYCCVQCVCSTPQDIHTLRIFFRNDTTLGELFTITPPQTHNIKPNTEIPHKYVDTVSVISNLPNYVTPHSTTELQLTQSVSYQISPFMLPPTAPRNCSPHQFSALHFLLLLLRQSQQGTYSNWDPSVYYAKPLLAF